MLFRSDVCNVNSGWTSWDGTADITAKTGDKIVVVEVLTNGNNARKAGEATVTAKSE